MNLVEVEVLQGEPGAVEHARHGVGGGHQQSFFLAHEVHRGRFGMGEIGLHLEAVRLGPAFAAQQHGRRAVGQRGGVSGRQRALARGLVERQAQRGQLVHRQVGAQVVVLRQAGEGHQQIAVKA